MKIFRICMVFVFMLAAIAAPHAAQAADAGKVGFIRLISSTDAKLPVQLQAQRAYSLLKPKLLAFQKSGTILAFEPEFKAGIVKILYAASRANADALSQYKIFDNIQDAVVRGGTPKARLSSQAASPEALSPFFYMGLYDSCFEAIDLGADSYVTGSLRDKTGRLVASYSGYADSSGALYYDCFPWTGPYTNVTPGYTVTFKVYDTSNVLLGTFSTAVPKVDFTSITKSTAIVRGTAPAGSSYQLAWSHRTWNMADDWPTVYKTGTVASNAVWSLDMSTGWLRGGDELEIQVIAGTNFNFANLMNVPYIDCDMGGNFCEISGFAFQPATLTIVHAGKTYPFSGKFDAQGYFSVELENAGNPIFLQAGDKVSGTSVPVYTLPIMSTRINFITNVVYGKAPPNRNFDLWVYTDCGCSSYWVYARSNATGDYTHDFTSNIDLVYADPVDTLVYFQDLLTGNLIYFRRSFGP